MRKVCEEQMVAVMREADRGPVAVVAERDGISEQTNYAWRKAVRRIGVERRAAAEATRGGECGLKKLVAERDLEIEVMKDVAAKNWRACWLVGVKLRMAGSVVFWYDWPARCSRWRDRR
jgi:putative transposase